MVLSRLCCCFFPKSYPFTAYRPLHTPILGGYYDRQQPAPPSPLPIFVDDRSRPESPPSPFPIFDADRSRPESPPSPLPIFDDDRSRSESPPSPLPIFDDDRSRPESPPIPTVDEAAPPRLIPTAYADIDGDCGCGNEEKTSAMYRIENELRMMNEEAPTHCSFGPVAADIFRWEGVVIGPARSCYEGGIFRLSIEFPADYPLSPPFIKFLTKVYHPNIGEDGAIYIDILNENWSSALTIEKLLLSICSILSNPYPQDYPINNWLKFNQTAREWTKTYAMET